MKRTIVAEFRLLGQPTTRVDAGDITEICTLLPAELPNESKVWRVIVVRRCCESVNVVCTAFPFHMICDWGTKLFPSTVSGSDSVSSGIVSGESEMITGCGTVPGQVLKLTIAVQLAQQKNNRVSTA